MIKRKGREVRKEKSEPELGNVKWHRYITANFSSFPFAKIIVPWRSWATAISKHVNARCDQDLYRCPGYNGPTIIDTKTNDPGSIGGADIGSYGLNDRGVGLAYGTGGFGMNHPIA